MRLIDAPVGVFRFSGDLVLKTEYMVDIDGVWIPDCYILDSGEKFWGGMKSTEDFKTKYNDLEVEVIDVEPQKMRGKWIEREVTHIDELEAKDIITAWQSCKCSVCGRYDTRPYMYYFGEPKYCSWCGADMRGTE